ncbi:MAG: hypothetical protein ACI8QC_003868 [Planctomycetota bacterium]|jgi:hypothetical protein
MLPMRTALLPLLALPLLLTGFSRKADSIALQPKSDLVLRKSFELTLESEKETSEEDSEEDSSMTTHQSSMTTLVVLDTIIEADAERATHMQRVYEEVAITREASMESGSNSDELITEGTCALIGETLDFQWDTDDESYALSCEADVDLSEEPRFDLDLSEFLPEGEVDEGDSWGIEGQAFRDTVDFLAGLPIEWDDLVEPNAPSGSGHGSGSSTGEAGAPEEKHSTDGEVVFTYAGSRSIDDVLVAVISLKGEIETEDSLDSARSMEGHSFETHTSRNRTATIEGELLWNIEGGHAHSLTIEITEETEGTVETIIDVGGQQFGGESTTTGSGTRTINASYELVE